MRRVKKVFMRTPFVLRLNEKKVLTKYSLINKKEYSVYLIEEVNRETLREFFSNT